MGRYHTEQISINVNAVYRMAERFDLPKPRPSDDWACYLTAGDVKKYLDFAEGMELTGERAIVIAVMDASASNYIYKATTQAPSDPKARRKFLQRRSHAYKLWFV